MSDISIQFPWWTSIIFVLINTFWPLTIVAAAAAIWVFLARKSRVAWIVAGVVAIPWVLSAAGNVYVLISNARTQQFSAAYDRAHLRTLANDEVVSGMQLPAGTVLRTSENFQLTSLELSKPALLFGVPLTGTVTLHDGKLDGSQTLQRDATIEGLPCAADGGATFGDGHLSDCRLAHPATIRGVPCRGYVTIHADFLGCELATPYVRYGVTWYPGTDVRGNEADLTFTVGSQSPSLRVLGSSLPKGTMIGYRNGTIDSIALNTFHYRGCTLTAIERRNGVMTAEVDGPCSLPALPNGRARVPNL
jgi:hypothetical protein